MTAHVNKTALVTGVSRGLGRAIAAHLAAAGWRVIGDARDVELLRQVAADVPHLVPVVGDITDPTHRQALAGVVGDRLDLLILSAGTLGPAPLPRLADLPAAALQATLETNVVAQVQLLQAVLPPLRRANGTVVAMTSDAAVEAYPGWGAYGASKAALDRLAAVLAVEEPALRVYAIDPGDLRTDMHQAAFPDEDISDRPLPETVVPALLGLLARAPASGRYRAAAGLTAEINR